MSWLRRRRGKHAAPRVVFLGRSPFDRPTRGAELAPAASQVAVPQVAAPRMMPPAPRLPQPAVRLGFRDGSVMALADDDPQAVALREVADRLTGEPG